MDDATEFILLSLGITLLFYSVFPILFAVIRRKPITKRRYTVISFMINFAVMLYFVYLNNSSTGMPYCLWTTVFTYVGKAILEKKTLIVEHELTYTIHFCPKCDYTCEHEKTDITCYCPQCGSEMTATEFGKSEWRLMSKSDKTMILNKLKDEILGATDEATYVSSVNPNVEISLIDKNENLETEAQYGNDRNNRIESQSASKARCESNKVFFDELSQNGEKFISATDLNKTSFQQEKTETDLKDDVSIMYCLKCGNKIDDECVFCPKCGSKIHRKKYSDSNKKEKIKFCRKCGYKLKEDSEFCSRCGVKI